MVRRGVGATIAAAVLFSSLLASNFLLVAGDQQMSELTSFASREQSLHVQALAAEGAGLLDYLDSVEANLGSAPLGCSEANSSVAAVLAESSLNATMGGVHVEVRGSPASAPRPDNLTPLAQFSGAERGALDISAEVTMSGSDPLGAVRYRSTQTHLLHIPMEVQTLAGRCEALLLDGVSALRSLGVQLCNSTAVSEAISPIEERAAREGQSQRFTLSYSLEEGHASCHAVLAVHGVEVNIQGPLGPFSCAVQQTETVYWGHVPAAVP